MPRGTQEWFHIIDISQIRFENNKWKYDTGINEYNVDPGKNKKEVSVYNTFVIGNRMWSQALFSPCFP